MEQQPVKLFADTIDPIHRDDPQRLFFLRIEARPDEGSVEAAEVAGGYANVWVDTDDFRAAEIEALDAIRAEGWMPHRFDDWGLRSREDCPDEGLESFDEAADMGISLTIYTWGHDDAEEQETEQVGASDGDKQSI